MRSSMARTNSDRPSLLTLRISILPLITRCPLDKRALTPNARPRPSPHPLLLLQVIGFGAVADAALRAASCRGRHGQLIVAQGGRLSGNPQLSLAFQCS